MNQKLLTVILLSSVLLLLTSHCSKKNQESTFKKFKNTTLADSNTDSNAASFQNNSSISIVCIWDGISVRESPLKNSKQLSSLSLGETVTYLDTSLTDVTDKNREYFKIRLSDGKQGWVPSYGVLKNASSAVLKINASLYKRPDLLTITDIRLSPMEFFAITNKIDDWVEVTGEQKKKVGWIKKDAITTNKEDIAMAILITKKLAVNDDLSSEEKLKTLLNEAPYPKSIFIENIRQKLSAESLSASLGHISNDSSDGAPLLDSSDTDSTNLNYQNPTDLH